MNSAGSHSIRCPLCGQQLSIAGGSAAEAADALRAHMKDHPAPGTDDDTAPGAESARTGPDPAGGTGRRSGPEAVPGDATDVQTADSADPLRAEGGEPGSGRTETRGHPAEPRAGGPTPGRGRTPRNGPLVGGNRHPAPGIGDAHDEPVDSETPDGPGAGGEDGRDLTGADDATREQPDRTGWRGSPADARAGGRQAATTTGDGSTPQGPGTDGTEAAAGDTAAEQKRTPVRKLADRADQKVDDLTRKAVTAAATGAGVPAPIADKALETKLGGKVVKTVRRGVGVLVTFAVVISVAIFSGTFDTDGAEDTAYNVGSVGADGRPVDIPDPYLDAYQSAAREHDLPWTLLAAIGQRASDHGRINPYLQAVPSPTGVTVSGGAVVKIFHVGDSLGDGMRYQGGLGALAQQRGIEYQAATLSGKRIEWGTQQLVANEEKWQNADVVVNLGTNDWTRSMDKFNRDIDAFMSAMPPTQRVWWLTLNRPGSIEYNNALREATVRWPNIRILDWENHALANSILATDSSQIHYGRTGYTAMAEFVLDQLTAATYSGGTPVSGTTTTRVGPGALPVPTGSCPTLVSPIEGTTGNQGAGPLMLKPSALLGSGHDLGDRVQNICDSVDALAEIVADTAKVVAEEQGLTWPRGVAQLAVTAARDDNVSAAAAKQVTDFWAEVVNRLTVLGTTEIDECGFGVRGTLDDVTYTGAMIYSYWTCELNNHPLQSVKDIIVDNGVVSQQLLTQQEAVTRAVQEALSVAWTWSGWSVQTCDPAAEVAGIFPMDQTTFLASVPDEFSGEDRCDAKASIAAAAALFAKGESTAAAARSGLWSTSIGGWTEFAHVSGPIGPSLFDQEGPWVPLEATSQCARVLLDRFVGLAGTTDAFTGLTALVVQSYVSDGLPVEVTTILDAEMNATLAAAKSDPACRQTRTHVDAEWFATVRAAYGGDFLSDPETGESGVSRLPRPTTGSLLVTASAGDKVAAISRRASDLEVSTVAVATPGFTPLLVRLSHLKLTVTRPPELPRSTVGEGLSVGAQVINVASSVYGGLYVGQKISGAAGGIGVGMLGDAVPYATVFNAIGNEYGIDPRMLAAIAFQESNFNVASHCDQLDDPKRSGYGMMQNDVGPDRRDERVRICELVETDPEGAATYQVRQAADKFNAFLRSVGGDVEGALLAYNSGTDLGKYWVQVKPDLEALRREARRYWCARNPTGWPNLANESRSGCEGRGDVTVKYVNPEPGVRSAINKYREYVQLYPTMVFTAAQTLVSGSGCPEQIVSLIPGKRILRDGADQIGLRQLCLDSVAQAATPEAAQAIIYVFNNLGKIYDRDKRSKPNFYDCSSYVTRAYQSAGVVMNDRGWLLTTRFLMPWDGHSRPSWITEVSPFEARPGDLAFPIYGHVEMKLAHGFYAHAPRTGDVTHIHRTDVIQYNRVQPSLAPRMTPTE